LVSVCGDADWDRDDWEELRSTMTERRSRRHCWREAQDLLQVPIIVAAAITPRNASEESRKAHLALNSGDSSATRRGRPRAAGIRGGVGWGASESTRRHELGVELRFGFASTVEKVRNRSASYCSTARVSDFELWIVLAAKTCVAATVQCGPGVTHRPPRGWPLRRRQL
jgi:hypothetical protein